MSEWNKFQLSIAFWFSVTLAITVILWLKLGESPNDLDRRITCLEHNQVRVESTCEPRR